MTARYERIREERLAPIRGLLQRDRAVKQHVIDLLGTVPTKTTRTANEEFRKASILLGKGHNSATVCGLSVVTALTGSKIHNVSV